MKIRVIALPLILAFCLSGVYFLPTAGKIAQSAVIMQLPDGYGTWRFNKIPASKAEIETLADDTEFSKAVCLQPRPGEYSRDGAKIPDRIDLSIVLSGADINNSIHRPERCMPAQGHQILSSSDQSIDLENGKTLNMKRLMSLQRIPLNAQKTEFLELNCVTYYFFVGHDQITNSHLGRTFVDMKDRLLRGMDQRWAYVSASMWYGEIPWMEGSKVTEADADKKLTDFLEGFSENQIDWNQIGF